MSALYVPVMLMLAGLAFRGVAIEFYHESPNRARWGLAFGLGSLVATVAQGFTLEAVEAACPSSKDSSPEASATGSIPSRPCRRGGGRLRLLGTTYLAMKSDGDLRQRAKTSVLAAWAVLADLP